MKEYSYRLDNKINSYTIYYGERPLLPQEVVDLLNKHRKDKIS